MKLTRAVLPALLALVLPQIAAAQSVPAYQMGTSLPNDLAKWQRNGQLRDAGTVAGDNNGLGVNPFAATDYGQRGICSNSKVATGPYSQLCLGHDSAGNPVISSSSLAGEPAHKLKLVIDGVTTDLPPVVVPGGALATPQDFGCIGDGTADDTSCLQTALNSAAASGAPLYFDAIHKYKIATGLTVNEPLNIIGPYRAGAPIYSTSCPSGIIANADITAITFTAISGSIQGMCFQMAPAAGTRTSGAGIKAGSVLGTTPAPGQSRVLLAGNTVIFGYDGIVIGGNTTGGGAAPTQTNGNVVRDNVIISASNEGFSQGRQSTGISTNGTTYANNQIACFSAYAAATGYAFYDGDFWLDATGAGPYQCNIGVKITPGAGQGFNGSFLTGVMGDTMGDVGLLIDSTSPASLGVNSIVVNNWWAATWSTTAAGGGAVRIQDTGGGSRVKSISLVGGLANICTTGGGGGHDITGIKIKDDVFDVMIANNRIYPSCLGTGGTGIDINSPGAFGTSRVSVLGNSFDTSGGQLTTGVKVGNTTDSLIISHNMMAAGAVTPITWSPGKDTRAIVKDNVSDYAISVPAITAAADIAAPFNEVFLVNGTTTVQTMANMWSNREVMIVPGGVFTIATTGTTTSGPGGKGKFCNGLTSTVSLPITAKWLIGNQCWHVK